MRNLSKFLILAILINSAISSADTPPPGSVKAKLFSGDGLTSITATGSAINSKPVTSAMDPVFSQIIHSGASIDPRQIRALTSADAVSCVQSGPWAVTVSGTIGLPANAATESTLATVAKESGGNLESIADDAAATRAAVESLNTKTTAVNTGAVTVASSALPTGAATQATLATRASEATLATRASETTAAAAAASLSSIDSKITTTVDGIRVDVGGATFTANSDLNDGAGNPITSTVDGAKRRLDVSVQSPLAIEGGNATAVKVDGSAVTQPISAAALPLPTGAATETTLGALNTKVTTTVNGIKVDGSAVTQPVSVGSLPLPTGAATEATLATRATEATQQIVRDRLIDINTKMNSLGQKTKAGSMPVTLASDQDPITVTGTVAVSPGLATEATLSALNAKVRAYDVDTSGVTENVQGVSIRLPGSSGSTSGGTTAAPLRVDPTGTTTQPVSIVSGTITLPAGISTEAKQDVGNASLASLDSKVVTADTDDVTITSSVLPTGAATETTLATRATEATLATRASESTLSTLNSKVTAVDTGNVTVVASALPAGAATSANQTTGNASLASIDGKISGYDLDTGAGTETAQGITLRKSASGGSVELGTSTDPIRTDPTGTTTQPISGTVNALQSGTWDINNITGSVSLPTGAATASNQATGNASLSAIQGSVASIDGKLNSLGQKAMAASAPVVIASDQSAVPASQSGTWDINNISGTVSLPTGASTAANQATGNATLSSIDGKFNSLGQKTSAGSAPVVIASDQSAVPASQSGTWDINNISGTVSLPTGAATAANQATGNASLSSIDGKLNSLGQKASAASAPVVLASDQSAIPATQSGTWSVRAQDGSGNNLTSTTVGASRALDANVVRNVNNQDQSASGTIAALNATVVGSSNGGGSFVFALSGTWSATAVLEGSIDGATWTQINFAPVGGGAAVSSTTSNGVYRALSPGGFSQVRVRASAYSSGTMSVAVNSGSGSSTTLANQLNAANLQTQISANNAGSPVQITADSSGNLTSVGNVASGATDSGSPVKVGGRFNTTLPSISNGQRADLQTNSFGELAVAFRNKSFRQAGATAGTLIKSGVGRIHQVCSTVYNGAGTLNLYDNTSATGTKIFSLVPSNNNSAQSMCSGPLGIEYTTGLYLVTTGANQTWYVVYQ